MLKAFPDIVVCVTCRFRRSPHEHVLEQVLGDLAASHLQTVAGILHLQQALLQHTSLVRNVT